MQKLSESILIGSSVVKAKPGRQYSIKENSGCAIGMAVVGAGGRFVLRAPGSPTVYRSDGLEWWPWTINLEKRPCRCRFVLDQLHPTVIGQSWAWLRSSWSREMPVKNIITHLFDYHVFGKEDWTIEQLAQWVASVEPRACAEPLSDGDLAALVKRNVFRLLWRERLKARKTLRNAQLKAIQSKLQKSRACDRFSAYT